MKTTAKYGFKLLETSDLMSITPLNENAQLIENELIKAAKDLTDSATAQSNALSDSEKGLKNKIELRAMMATGSYVGNGTGSVEISTPGFKPAMLMMFCEREEYEPASSGNKVTADSVKFDTSDFDCSGFTMWNGADINTAYWFADGTAVRYNPATDSYEDVPVYTKTAAKVKFTPTDGALRWELGGGLDAHEKYGPEYNVNNVEGVTYKWVAFGFKEEG